MTEAASILVIILSVFLAIFLITVITLVVLLIKITRKINAVTGSFKNTAENVETVVAGVSKVASPMLIAKIIMRQFGKSKKRKGRNDG